MYTVVTYQGRMSCTTVSLSYHQIMSHHIIFSHAWSKAGIIAHLALPQNPVWRGSAPEEQHHTWFGIFLFFHLIKTCLGPVIARVSLETIVSYGLEARVLILGGKGCGNLLNES